jgi:hypothetical protein
MSEAEQCIPSATRPVRPALSALLRALKPGQRIRITQTVRIGARTWTTTITGTFRDLNFLATGLATQRMPEDDIVVPTVHFIKDPHGELSCVTLDEQSDIEVI